MEVHRGDVVGVELHPTHGSEQSGTDPRLVVQNDVGNENDLTTVVLPVPTSFGDELSPLEVLVEAEDEPLRGYSVALCSQVLTLSIEHRIVENPESIPDSWREIVVRALEYSLCLGALD